MKFEQLQLSSYMTTALLEQGITEATEIQSLAIPPIIEGRDVLGLSHTGSGKTFAFVLPALEILEPRLANIQVLIVYPTRELVMQTTEEIRKVTQYKEGIKTVPIFGGGSIDKQIQALRRNAKIVVGTPGRLMDHLRRKTLKLHALKLLVLDEADEMLNMGFREDIETILQSVSTEHQTVMFSATMPKEIKEISKQYMNDAITVQSSIQDKAQTFILQQYVQCGKDKKYDTLLQLRDKHNPATAIIFCNTKAMTEQLAEKLTKDNITALCLNGDKRQSERRKVMESFKSNGGMLIATDVAARGIDVKNVDIVINYDIPTNPEYYVHRIGRTARAGKDGLAVTIINTKKQLHTLRDLIHFTGNEILETLLVDSKVVLDKAKRGKKVDNYQSKKQQYDALTKVNGVTKPKAKPTPKPVSREDSIEVLIEEYLSQRSKNKKKEKYLNRHLDDIDEDTMRTVLEGRASANTSPTRDAHRDISKKSPKKVTKTDRIVPTTVEGDSIEAIIDNYIAKQTKGRKSTKGKTSTSRGNGRDNRSTNRSSGNYSKSSKNGDKSYRAQGKSYSQQSDNRQSTRYTQSNENTDNAREGYKGAKSSIHGKPAYSNIDKSAKPRQGNTTRRTPNDKIRSTDKKGHASQGKAVSDKFDKVVKKNNKSRTNYSNNRQHKS